MRIKLIMIGKTTDKLYINAINDYISRIGHYNNFSVQIIPGLKNTKNLSHEQQKQNEGYLVQKEFSPSDKVILLDENGKEFKSVEFARWLENKQQTTQKLVFVIGGPYGFSDDIYNRADEKISLSKMTFSHQMVRLIFVEQLYRACTIIKGESYHHE